MKVVGAFLIFGGCIGWAYQYLERLRRKCTLLEEWREILELMEGEIRYGRMTFPECFLQIGAQVPSLLGGTLWKIGKMLEEQPQKNPCKEVELQFKERLRGTFTEEEIEKLFLLPVGEGYQDERMQRRMLERKRENVEKRIVGMKEEYGGKSRVAYCLGTMSGIIMVLLLL